MAETFEDTDEKKELKDFKKYFSAENIGILNEKMIEEMN